MALTSNSNSSSSMNNVYPVDFPIDPHIVSIWNNSNEYTEYKKKGVNNLAKCKYERLILGPEEVFDRYMSKAHTHDGHKISGMMYFGTKYLIDTKTKFVYIPDSFCHIGYCIDGYMEYI